MASLAALDIVEAWLNELRCPRPIDASFDPELIESLAFLSRRATGRRGAAHVRKEIHRMRIESKNNLSAPTRQLLGLDLVETSTKSLDLLRIAHARSQDALALALEESQRIATSDGAQLERLLDHQLLAVQLQDRTKEWNRAQTQIEGLVKLFQAHATTSNDLEPSTQVANLIRQLQSGATTLPPDASPRLTLTGLADLVELQRKTEEQLSDLIERKLRYPPPTIDVLETKLFEIRSRCVEQSSRLRDERSTSVKVHPTSRAELLEAIAASRARQAVLSSALESSYDTAILPPRAIAREEIETLESNLLIERTEIQSLLSLRVELQERIREISSLIEQEDIVSYMARLDDAARISCSSSKEALDRIKSELDVLRSAPTMPVASKNGSSEDRQLFLDGLSALHLSHLLAIQPPRPPTLSAIEIEESSNRIASSRSALEALLPRMEEATSYDYRTESLEESIRQRGLLVSGMLLPPSKNREGSLQERWRKMEKEFARLQKGRK